MAQSYNTLIPAIRCSEFIQKMVDMDNKVASLKSRTLEEQDEFDRTTRLLEWHIDLLVSGREKLDWKYIADSGDYSYHDFCLFEELSEYVQPFEISGINNKVLHFFTTKDEFSVFEDCRVWIVNYEKAIAFRHRISNNSFIEVNESYRLKANVLKDYPNCQFSV